LFPIKEMFLSLRSTKSMWHIIQIRIPNGMPLKFNYILQRNSWFWLADKIKKYLTCSTFIVKSKYYIFYQIPCTKT
jgi:hypothetical protein